MANRLKLTILGGLCVQAGVLAPATLASWVSAGPFGGNAEAIVASASQPNLLLAATKNATLSISRNAGETWEPLAFPRQYTTMLHAVAIDPKNPAVFFVAIQDNTGSGLYRSADGGHTWKALEGIGASEVYSIAFWGKDSQVIAAGLRQGVCLSRDGGTTWKAISPAENIALQPVVSVAFDPTNADIIYAGTPRLPWKTTDGGASWNLIAEGMSTDSDIITVRVDPSKPARVFIGACSGFWRSHDGGAVWAKMAGIPFSSRRTYAFAQDPHNTDIIFAGTSRGLYRTRNGGVAWQEISSHEIKSLAIAEGTLYVATADSGLFKTRDEGATFQPIDQGFVSRNFARIGGIGEHLYTGSNYDADAGAFFSSEDGGRHWQPIGDGAALGNESVVAVTRTAAGTLVAATGSSLYRSTDGGKVWTRMLPAPPKPVAKAALRARQNASKNKPVVIPPLSYGFSSLCSLEGALLAGGDTGIYRSTDEGQTWSKVVATTQPVRSLLDSDSIIAALPEGLLVSSDQGVTWATRHTPFFTEVYDVAAAGNTLMAGTSRGLFHSEDGGQTWRVARSGLPAASITSVAIDPLTRKRAFAYEYGNLFESRDAGNTWQPYDRDGLGGAFVRSFTITGAATAPGQHNLLAVTATRGIFLRDLDEASGSPSHISAVDLRKDRYVPNQQNDKTPAF
jgi:photosystem II stability/assembly factor-like uncharacterized protein